MSTPKRIKRFSAALKATQGTTKKFGAKSDFILAHPIDRAAAEIVAEGAKQGLSFTRGYVHSVRLRARSSSGTRRPRYGTVASEASLAQLAIDIGLNRAEAVLRHLRAELTRTF